MSGRDGGSQSWSRRARDLPWNRSGATWRSGIATILLAAMVFNLVIAGVAGGLVPLALERFAFDPAIASSIFVTTFTDVGGFFSFLGLATLALRIYGHP